MPSIFLGSMLQVGKPQEVIGTIYVIWALWDVPDATGSSDIFFQFDYKVSLKKKLQKVSGPGVTLERAEV